MPCDFKKQVKDKDLMKGKDKDFLVGRCKSYKGKKSMKDMMY